MRIQFTRFPLESAHGGAENQTMWLAAGLRERGHDVSFLGSCPVLRQTFAASGFPVTPLDIGEPPVTKFGAVSFLWRRAAMLRKLRQAYENLPVLPEAVFMLSLSEKILLTDFLASRGVKVFWIEHDRVGRWLTGNPWLGALKAASAHATIVCVSELSRQKYLALGFDAGRTIAIPNGIPLPEVFQPEREAGATLTVGSVARLSPEKGLDVLIHSIAEIPEVTLRIVGKGPQESFLRSMIAEDAARIGIPRITLQSTVPNLDLFYAALDVFVLPSTDHDPFGLTAAEAMARGIPTIVTDQCGIAGSLTDGEDALIVPAGSASALSDAIRKLCDPPLRKRLSAAGRKTAGARFALGTMVGAYERLLR